MNYNGNESSEGTLYSGESWKHEDADARSAWVFKHGGRIIDLYVSTEEAKQEYRIRLPSVAETSTSVRTASRPAERISTSVDRVDSISGFGFRMRNRVAA